MWPYTRSGVQFHHLVLMDKNINEANWDLDSQKVSFETFLLARRETLREV